jgi:hypothetical protein
MCPMTTMCVLIPLYMCPHPTVSVSAYVPEIAGLIALLLYMCPHTTIYVSSYHYICVLIPLHMCPHTTTCVSSYHSRCVLIPLYMCPHTTIYVSSCDDIGPLLLPFLTSTSIPHFFIPHFCLFKRLYINMCVCVCVYEYIYLYIHIYILQIPGQISFI